MTSRRPTARSRGELHARHLFLKGLNTQICSYIFNWSTLVLKLRSSIEGRGARFSICVLRGLKHRNPPTFRGQAWGGPTCARTHPLNVKAHHSPMSIHQPVFLDEVRVSADTLDRAAVYLLQVGMADKIYHDSCPALKGVSRSVSIFSITPQALIYAHRFASGGDNLRVWRASQNRYLAKGVFDLCDMLEEEAPSWPFSEYAIARPA